MKTRIDKADRFCKWCKRNKVISARSKYCIECVHKPKRKLKDKNCQGCGSIFRPRDSLKKFCSAKCGYENRPLKGTNFNCICGKIFYRGRQKDLEWKKIHCSRKCAHKGALKNTPLNCKVCKKEYYRPISQVKWRGTGYCSNKCKGKGYSVKAKKARFDKSKYPKALAKFKKWVWKVFSDYVRERDGWICFTCGKPAKGKNMHAGHFIPRTYSATLFNEINVNAQCYSCNIWKRGNAGEYSMRLIEKYGKEKIDELIINSRQIHKFTYEELENLYQRYKELLKTLTNTK